MLLSQHPGHLNCAIYWSEIDIYYPGSGFPKHIIMHVLLCVLGWLDSIIAACSYMISNSFTIFGIFDPCANIVSTESTKLQKMLENVIKTSILLTPIFRMAILLSPKPNIRRRSLKGRGPGMKARSQRMSVSVVVMEESWFCVIKRAAPKPITFPVWTAPRDHLVRALAVQLVWKFVTDNKQRNKNIYFV